MNEPSLHQGAGFSRPTRARRWRRGVALYPKPFSARLRTSEIRHAGVALGFASKGDQGFFNVASNILVSNEQNLFAAAAGYALPNGSRTGVDRIADPIPNGDEDFDRIHVHLRAVGSDAKRFATFMTEFAVTLAAD